MPTKVKHVQRKAKSKQRKAAPRKRGGQAVRPTVKRSVLDGTGLAYARLLDDPCNAKLTGFYGGTSGYVQRFTSTFAVGTAATSTAGAFIWVPGNGGLMSSQDVPNEGSTFAAFNYASTSFPGFGFLNTSAKCFRVLACCAKVYTNANESNRTGFLYYGNVGNQEAPTNVNTPGQLETLLPVTIRTPVDSCEIKWAPGTGDVQYSTLGINVPNVAECQALVVGWSGQPAGVGFKVVLTAVVEWLPNMSIGSVENAMIPSGSSNSIDEVKRALFSINKNWWHKAGNVLYRTVEGAVMSGTMIGGLTSGMKALSMRM